MLGIERIEKLSNADIKALLVVGNTIITAGREGKIRVGDCKFSKHKELSPKRGYINCLAMGHGLLFAGCQDGSIAVYTPRDYDYSSSMDGKMPCTIKEPNRFLYGHTSNVCCLDILGNFILSSSWDFTVKLWKLEFRDSGENKFIMSISHPAAVWAAKFVKEDVFVTGCADKLLRFYKGETLVNTISYHISCIRSIVVLESDIISVDNEGIVIKASLDGKLLRHHSTRDFIYNLSLSTEDGNKNPKVICSGENGQVMILDKDLKLIDKIAVPATSCWGAVESEGKIYVGSSDGRLYVYSSNESEEMVKLLEDIRSKQVSPLKDGEFISENQKFKVVDGDVYQEINGEWIFLGKGEGAKPCDNTFQVELDNKYYTLSFNNNENVYEVAEKFIRKNKLGDEFRDDIVDFIKKNFAPADKFRIYSTINADGVRSILKKNRKNGSQESDISDQSQCPYPYIIKNLEKPDAADNEEVERELKALIADGPVFAALDLFRYFVAHKYSFDFSFMLRFVPKDKKEAVTFVRLINNLFSDPPFNLDVFYPYIMKLKDSNIVGGEVLDDYFINRGLSNKM